MERLGRYVPVERRRARAHHGWGTHLPGEPRGGCPQPGAVLEGRLTPDRTRVVHACCSTPARNQRCDLCADLARGGAELVDLHQEASHPATAIQAVHREERLGCKAGERSPIGWRRSSTVQRCPCIHSAFSAYGRSLHAAGRRADPAGGADHALGPMSSMATTNPVARTLMIRSHRSTTGLATADQPHG